MAPRDTTKADSTDTPDTSDSTAATSPPAEPQRIVIEQAPAEPSVFYGDGGILAPTMPAPTKARYEPFTW